MKKLIPIYFVLLAFIATMPNGMAQENRNSNENYLVVIKKTTAEDGTITIRKERIEKGKTLEEYQKTVETDNENERNVEITILKEGASESAADKENTIFYFRQKKEEGSNENEIYRIIYSDDESGEDDKHYNFKNNNGNNSWNNGNWNWNWDANKATCKKNNRAYLGVYLEDTDNGEGAYIENLVGNGAASKAGIEPGDVVTNINGTKVQSASDLSKVLRQLQPGDVAQVSYVRNNQTYQKEVTLGQKSNYNDWRDRRDPCQVFIGIYSSPNREGAGVIVNKVIDDTPANKSNVQRGDLILTLDDVGVNNHSEVIRERNKHQPGEWFTLGIIRDGVRMDIDAQFKSCEEAVTEKPTVVEPEIEEIVTEELEAPVFETEFNTLKLDAFTQFPNPTYGDIEVKFTAEARPTVLMITDLTGKVILQKNLINFNGTYNETLNVGNAAPGTLLVTVRQDDKIFTKKFVLLARA